MSYGLRLTDIPPFEAIPSDAWAFYIEKASKEPISALPKYWGSECVLEEASDGSVWKLITMRAGTQSSLEYHTSKRETYFLIDGVLDIGVRIGRAENHTLKMRSGWRFDIPIGLMHLRMAKTNVTLLEWASLDNPRDSHLVQDGRKYIHKDGPADGP